MRLGETMTIATFLAVNIFSVNAFAVFFLFQWRVEACPWIVSALKDDICRK